MKKRGHYFLIIGSSLLLAGSIAGGLTATILTYDQSHSWNINPYKKYDFEKAKKSLLKAKVPSSLVNEYLELAKKITGVIKTDEIVKASELLDLNNKIMNSISQRIIWNDEDPLQVKIQIDLAKPILIQFYEYYDHVYIYENNLQHDSLNNMQLKSANTDLYKWSIWGNISDYGLIRNYLESAEEAWISKMSMSYIFKTFLNKKMVLYNSLINQANDEITAINKQIEQILNDQNQLLLEKIDAQDQYTLVRNTLSSINGWEKELDLWYGLTFSASAAQLAMAWFPPVAYALAAITLGFGWKYSKVEDKANKDLGLQMGDIQEWVNDVKDWSEIAERMAGIVLDMLRHVKDVIDAAFIGVMEVIAKIVGWVMSFVSLALLTVDFVLQKNMFAEARLKVANPNSDVSNAINDYIDDIDDQMNDISMAIKNLNDRQNDYMNQKISFNGKLKELSNHNEFFKDFDSMNEETFTQTNIFTSEQIKSWQIEVERKYGYLTESSTTTDDFIKAFTEEKNNFNIKYLKVQNKEKQFMDNYRNNDKEYFIKNLLTYVDSPLKNNWIYFDTLDIGWNNYDDIFRK